MHRTDFRLRARSETRCRQDQGGACRTNERVRTFDERIPSTHSRNATMNAQALTERLHIIEALRDEILTGADEAQRIRRLPNDLVARLVETGFFRFTLPIELGGEDASALDTIAILESLAALDASVAWNVMLGSEINAMAAGGMDLALAKEVYVDNPGVIMCGGGGPGSTPPRAERQKDGGVRVWGQTTFISGCHNAQYCFMGAPLMRGDEIEKGSNGMPIF